MHTACARQTSQPGNAADAGDDGASTKGKSGLPAVSDDVVELSNRQVNGWSGLTTLIECCRHNLALFRLQFTVYGLGLSIVQTFNIDRFEV